MKGVKKFFYDLETTGVDHRRKLRHFNNKSRLQHSSGDRF